MKKIYMQPEMRVVKIQRRFSVLVGSDPDVANKSMGSSHQFSRGGNSDDGYEE